MPENRKLSEASSSSKGTLYEIGDMSSEMPSTSTWTTTPSTETMLTTTSMTTANVGNNHKVGNGLEDPFLNNNRKLYQQSIYSSMLTTTPVAIQMFTFSYADEREQEANPLEFENVHDNEELTQYITSNWNFSTFQLDSEELPKNKTKTHLVKSPLVNAKPDFKQDRHLNDSIHELITLLKSKNIETLIAEMERAKTFKNVAINLADVLDQVLDKLHALSNYQPAMEDPLVENIVKQTLNRASSSLNRVLIDQLNALSGKKIKPGKNTKKTLMLNNADDDQDD